MHADAHARSLLPTLPTFPLGESRCALRDDRLPSKSCVHAVVFDAVVAEYVGSRPVRISQHREEQVVGADVLVAQSLRFLARLSDDVPCSFSQVHGSELIPSPETTKTCPPFDNVPA
ncbi:MAG: hypothetical protein JWL76_1746 [Thermoleophilia bacterium]|nr:hypothetical protein [Thermoleophilia bacterium]